MTSQQTRQHLARFGIQPSRKLGQNFLTDQNTAHWIVEQLAPTAQDSVIEVGPGTGALTEHLIGRVRHLILVEYDRRLVQLLHERFPPGKHGGTLVEIHHADAASYDLRPHFASGPLKLLGNLPYSAGGAILRNFLKQPTPVDRAVLMLQREVIDRIMAEPRTKAYSVLTLRMQSEWTSKPLKTIGPECFYPRPSIDSTVMVSTPRQPDLPPYNAKLLDQYLRLGFNQRRKQLHKALAPHLPKPWPDLAQTLKCPETARAEELTLHQWIQLTNLLDPAGSIPAQSPHELLDVVDGQDQIIGQATRDQIHREDLLHRAVHILLINKKNEILLQKRSRLKDRHPGQWDSSAAGHLDAGETYEQAARRELSEELGLQAQPPKPLQLKQIAKLPPTAQNGYEHLTLYLAPYLPDQHGTIQTPASEIEHTLWQPVNQLHQWIQKRPQDFAGGFRQCWQEILQTGWISATQ